MNTKNRNQKKGANGKFLRVKENVIIPTDVNGLDINNLTIEAIKNYREIIIAGDRDLERIRACYDYLTKNENAQSAVPLSQQMKTIVNYNYENN